VADGADAADASHDGRHLVDRTSLRDPLEAAELGDVEMSIDDLARSSSWMVILEWPSILVTDR